MSQPIDEIDPSVLVLRERVVQQALDLVKVNVESNRGKTVMQCFKNSVQVVLKLARLGESTQILTEYHDLILHIEKGIESFMKFTNDSGLADVEAIDISKEFQLYKKEKEIQIKDLQDEILQLKLESKSQGKKWSAKCDALAEKYKQLIQENEVLVAVERELIQENKHLEKLALKPDPVPEVVVVPPGSQELYKKEKQSQLERIGQLENHIANLEHAIDKWKLENESLQSDLQKLSVTRQQTDKDLQKAKQRATILQEQVKDEQLKNEKAAELIKQLQSRPVEEVDVPGEITRLELLLESQVKAFDQVSMPVGDDGSQIQVFQVMKSLNEKTSQITLLESQISGIFC
jgi:chromosome segregation ATPase